MTVILNQVFRKLGAILLQKKEKIGAVLKHFFLIFCKSKGLNICFTQI